MQLSHGLLCRAFALGVLFAPGIASAQAPPPRRCPPQEQHRFDFLIGNWKGRLYTLAKGDSTAEDVVVARNHKLPYGCAFEERWEFTLSDTIVDQVNVIRGYNLATKSWMYGLVSNIVEFATFESTLQDGTWAFTHDITDDGPPRRLRIRWLPTTTGYTEAIEVSSDSGRTWPVVRHLNFVRQAGAAKAGTS